MIPQSSLQMARKVDKCWETWNAPTLKICKLFADGVDKS